MSVQIKLAVPFLRLAHRPMDCNHYSAVSTSRTIVPFSVRLTRLRPHRTHHRSALGQSDQNPNDPFRRSLSLSISFLVSISLCSVLYQNRVQKKMSFL
ncbi:hypothetical protein F2Q70_00020146 [Brassica cretica]|uniref:Uncharacterized protein n=1 Tax=Brassica cretica TaxID=69181 RepID=A0A8S9HSD0_BRACR|nr:hypothetical protein F2Q70_00020146 [Brassica cretica]KAF2559847.1 hypothetical protein F2Q68_00013633 [Brassica cretica]